MKFLLRTLLVGGISYLGLQFFGWWIILPVGFIIGLLLSNKKRRKLYGKGKAPTFAFLAGFLALFLLWGGIAYWLDAQNASLLSGKIFDILRSGFDSGLTPAWAMIGLTALTGGLLGGFSTMTGNLLGEAIKN